MSSCVIRLLLQPGSCQEPTPDYFMGFDDVVFISRRVVIKDVEQVITFNEIRAEFVTTAAGLTECGNCSRRNCPLR